eukprot:COSAG01_NODE_76455_length_184_cov_85.058824_1_plen_43_part_10
MLAAYHHRTYEQGQISGSGWLGQILCEIWLLGQIWAGPEIWPA